MHSYRKLRWFFYFFPCRSSLVHHWMRPQLLSFCVPCYVQLNIYIKKERFTEISKVAFAAFFFFALHFYVPLLKLNTKKSVLTKKILNINLFKVLLETSFKYLICRAWKYYLHPSCSCVSSFESMLLVLKVLG